MTEEESLGVSLLLKKVRDDCVKAGLRGLVKAYLLGLEHGKAGKEVDPEVLFSILDTPN